MDGIGGIIWGCRVCGTAVPRKGDICLRCAAVVDRLERAKPLRGTEGKDCLTCGTPNRPNARFCHCCGTKLG